QLGIDSNDFTDPVWTSIQVDETGQLKQSTVAGPGIIAPTLDAYPSRARKKSNEAEQTSPVKRFLWRRPETIGALILPTIVVAGLSAWWLSSNDPSAQKAPQVQRVDRSSMGAAVSVVNPDQIATKPPSADRSQPAEMLAVGDDLVIEEASRHQSARDTFGLNLDALLPPEFTDNITPSTEPVTPFGAAVSVDDDTDSSAEDPRGSESESNAGAVSLDPSNMADRSGDLLSDDLMVDDGDADIVDQASSPQTELREPSNGFVTLPAFPSSRSEEAPIALVGFKADDQLTLSFPSDARLDLISDLSSNSTIIHRIRDSAKQNEVAVIESVDGPTPNAGHAELQFRWLPDSSRIGAARQLAWGRLTADNKSLDLRPTLQTDPIALDMTQRDLKLKWDLTSALPPAISQLDVQVQLSDALELGWIEPPDPDSPQRTRGIGVIQLIDDEQVAVAFRVDIRAGKIMTMRIRTGARLFSGMPWQWTDHRGVQQTQSTISGQLSVMQTQLIDVRAGFERAKRAGNRREAIALNERESQLETLISQATQLSEALSRLDRLMSEIAASGILNMSLTVQWPDRDQVVLTTRSSQ
ncbi:MAG: hypothetical protein AAF539_00735, partial [Planctomycetota bacterium]